MQKRKMYMFMVNLCTKVRIKKVKNFKDISELKKVKVQMNKIKLINN